MLRLRLPGGERLNRQVNAVQLRAEVGPLKKGGVVSPPLEVGRLGVITRDGKTQGVALFVEATDPTEPLLSGQLRQSAE